MLQIFKASYDRKAFVDSVLLPILQGKVDDLEIYDQYFVQELDLSESEKRYAKSVVKYGEFITRDKIGRTVELYEVILHGQQRMEKNRVAIAALLKNQIIRNNPVLVNFAYDPPKNRTWRFSFIFHNTSFFCREVVQSEAHPKHYTYIFGESVESYHIALERFGTLCRVYSITENSLKKAFGLKTLYKSFFDGYRDHHYDEFIYYLTHSEFRQSIFKDNKRAICNFIKKLLAQILFLYFIQQKGWLGASNSKYKDGDKNFIYNLYKKAGSNKFFYTKWLSKLLYDTLSTPRSNDAFVMPDGTSVMIPYLNGGLFEKLPNNYGSLTFPPDLFSDLFKFLNQFSFTICEDIFEERVVAIDPEMLGYLFENLLEDNKGKGAFYTPKEVVHYMAQESLIEYLHTQIPKANRQGLTAFIKNKVNSLSNEYKKQIDLKLNKVKVCDPAIGSGALPMGLLQEIFSLKERIAYELKYTVWNPVRIKQQIIQNSIYGVDIDQGAIDISRLRFWLTMIADEETPKALPNFDYKIVVGNSLVSNFEDEIMEIDWGINLTLPRKTKRKIKAEGNKLLQNISKKQKTFFTAKNESKPGLNAEIGRLKLDILAKQLDLMIASRGAERDSNFPSQPSKKQLEKYLETNGWKRTLTKIRQLKANDKHFYHFDWRLDFPEVLNPLVKSSNGFDIIIANPPYLSEKGNAEIFSAVNKSAFGKKWHQSKMDYWFYFMHLAMDYVNKNGVINFITSRYWLHSTGATKLIKRVQEELSFIDVVDFGEIQVFDSVGGHHMIHIYSKKNQSTFRYRQLKKKIEDIDIYTSNENVIVQELRNEDVFLGGIEISFTSKNMFSCEKETLGTYFEVSQGVIEASDKVSSKQYAKYGYSDIEVGAGVFVLNETELQALCLSTDEQNIIKEYVDPKQVTKYGIDRSVKNYLIYSDSINKDLILNNPSFSRIKKHLDLHSEFISSHYKPYGIHRARKSKFFERPKILFKNMFKRNEFYLDYDKLYCGMSFSTIISKGEDHCLIPLLGILNSKLALTWFYNNGKHRGLGVDIGVKKLRTFPIPLNFDSSVLSTVVNYLSFISCTKLEVGASKKALFETVDEVSNSLVYEMYFPKEFKDKGIEIEKYAKEFFIPINSLSDKKKLEEIRSVYERLCNKNNKLYNQIDQMKLRLKQTLNPFLIL